jgi:hypothetical protein
MTRLRNLAGRACELLVTLFEELARRLIVCPDCGRSRFYGESCQ